MNEFIFFPTGFFDPSVYLFFQEKYFLNLDFVFFWKAYVITATLTHVTAALAPPVCPRPALTVM